MSKNPIEHNTLRLREAVNQDSEKIKNLVFSVLKEYGLTPDPATTDADLKDIENSYFTSGGIFYLLEENDGSTIGTVGLYPLDKMTCELRKMYLSPLYRSIGLGKKLLDISLSKAKELGFKRVTLETASVLKEAIGLYLSYGFKEYIPEHLSGRCDQAYILEL